MTETSCENSEEKSIYTWRNGIKWKETIGWSFIDFSNSIYITIVISAVYSPFFTGYVAEGDIPTTLWSISLLIPTLLTLLIIPIIGSIVDLSGHRLAWLMFSVFGFSIFTLLLYFINDSGSKGMIAGSMIFIIFSRLMFNINEAIGSSYLSDCVYHESYIGFISGFGWMVGYIGGMIALAIVTFGIIESEESNNYVNSVQLGMLITGILCLITSLPTAICLWNLPSGPTIKRSDIQFISYTDYIWTHTKNTFKQLLETFNEIRKHKDLNVYLLGFFIYMIGVQAVISFMSIFAQDEIKLSSNQIAVMFVVIQLTAALGSFLFGLLEVRYGPKLVISITLVIWFVGVILCIIAPELCKSFGWDVKTFFICITPIAGMAMGPSQSCSRSLFSTFIPDMLSGEAYSVWEFILNISSAIAMIYGPLADGLSNRWAAGIISITFVIAFFILQFVNIDRGKTERAEWNDKLKLLHSIPEQLTVSTSAPHVTLEVPSDQ